MVKRLLSCALIVVFVFVFTSCKQAETNEGPTPEQTESVTKGPTQGPTPTPSPTKEPLSEEELGKPTDKSDIIYGNDFSDDDFAGEILVQQGNFSVKDGKLYLNSPDGGETWGGWVAITPDIDCYPSDAYQWEFHIEFQSVYPQETGDAVWMATIIGARVCNYNSAIADTDDGFWVGFTERNSITIYPSGSQTKGYWPGGAATVEIPEGFGEMKKVVIVDTGNSLFYYMNTSEEENVLILKADITEDKIIVFDGSGKKVFEAENFLDMQEGNHFKVFSHITGTVIDSLEIKAY
ncbi:MAG TPA: hypothetical protein GXZ66_06490 [Clostridiaceae bacterium]|jgi:hypothetical protein|nr:hypothetical protein [Clostridiaceae bacterium]